MAYIAFTAYKHGNPQKLAHPFDSDSRACGLDAQKSIANGQVTDMREYPFIYFAQPWIGGLNHTVCVKTCPVATDTAVECVVNSQVATCSGATTSSNGVTPAQQLSSLVTSHGEDQAAGVTGAVPQLFIYGTKGIYGRICIPWDPNNLNKLLAVVNTALPAANIQSYLGDVVDTKRVILWVSLTAVGVGFLFMIIQKYLAGLIVWVFIALYFLFLIALTWGFF
jgi:hypothetical protein